MKLHELLEGKNDKYIFKAIFLIGGPGSGKTTLFKTKISNGGFKSVNPDDIYEFKMKKDNLQMKYEKLSNEEKKKAEEHQRKSFALTNKRLNTFIAGRLPIVIDRTGSSFGKTLENKFILENLGYECFLIYVKTDDVEKAIERNEKRNRSVPKDYLKVTHKKVEENIPHFLDMFKNNIVIDNKNDDDKIKKVMAWMEKPVTNKKALEWIKGDKS